MSKALRLQCNPHKDTGFVADTSWLLEMNLRLILPIVGPRHVLRSARGCFKWGCIERLAEFWMISLRRRLFQIRVFETDLASLLPLKAPILGISDRPLGDATFCSSARIEGNAMTK
ncbi:MULTISPECIES: hypothetical protein [Agrobacterium tumefaciens complex]|uniref:Uncharacterized protein n=1 Tax=Agrobacterium arsenijevicii TaxID=1585697 RepID=A0ABR5D013_9HYPH|nr:hypothetical protein RP75_26340 [Agrobacterium arsenijevicii]OCJ08394.1 hypothetical protein A6U88_25155 [Agrobacterium sp. B131/95]OCJ27180.1 hypothetical protein A6U89_29785 [Agrobacterium sp. B133/95]